MNRFFLVQKLLAVLQRIFPAPILSGLLFLLWLLLANDISRLTLCVAMFLALIIPLYTAKLRPNRAVIRKPWLLVKLIGIVFWDMLLDNLKLIGYICGKRAKINPAFVRVPLDVRESYALAVLAMIINFTPGTIWAELSFDKSVLLIHCINVADEQEFINFIKSRYEAALMEIFE